MPDSESDVRPARVNTADRVGLVGVVGLGVMGHAIATRLHHQLGVLAVNDLRRDAANDLVDAGATYYGTAAEAAAHSDVVVLSLNTAPIVEHVVFGGDGVLAGWSSGRDGLIINQALVVFGFSALAEIAAMSRAADLTPTGNIDNMVKDLRTAAAAAHSENVNLPLTELVLSQNQELVAQGHGQGDNANLMRLYGYDE